MTHHSKTPILMGAAMGAMMLWMLHGAVTGENSIAGTGLLLFIGAHVLVIGAIAGLALFGASRFERVRTFLDRLHRPSLKHIATMIGTALIVVALTHLIHGMP